MLSRHVHVIFLFLRKERARRGLDGEENRQRMFRCSLSDQKVIDEKKREFLPNSLSLSPFSSTLTSSSPGTGAQCGRVSPGSPCWSGRNETKQKEKEKQSASSPVTRKRRTKKIDEKNVKSSHFPPSKIETTLLHDGLGPRPGQADAHRRPQAVSPGRQRPIHRARAR